ncbi:MAG: chromosome segregation protein SMC [Pseudomonadota bacterium]|nr:chromosome segregation protein SMC [Pseudomonadota bacterium]
MRIRSLELQGFKSFADRAVFRFGPGISGVVGPNGCGKSNVIDAVKWCIGEQSAKSLRGDSMADVIFAGSSTRQPVGFAEVTLTFEAGAEPFPGIWARFAELGVSRRLYRTGHSEYLVNQERVRLRDIQELFMDTGVGNQLYSVIEQGRIGQIVHAKPEQRRLLIEEAAGISRYKARREETMEKLATTRTALDRVADLADEMGRQLRSAERQVQRIGRWRMLQARLRQQEILVSMARCSGLVGDRKALAEQVRTLEKEVGEGNRAVERHEQELAERRKSQEALDEEAGRIRDRLAEVEAQRRVEESAAVYQARESSAGKERLQRLATDLTELRNERDSAGAEAVSQGAAREHAERELKRSRDALESATERARIAGETLRVTREELERTRRGAMEAFEAAVRARAAVAGIGGRRRDLAVRQERNQGQLAAAGASSSHFTEEIGRISAQMAEAEALVAQARQQVEAGRAATAGAEAERETANREQRRVDGLLTDATRERERVKVRLDTLEDLQRKNMDVPDGLKAVLAVPGVIGLLASQLDVPEALETLLARALDGALETALVPDLDVAGRAAVAAKGARARVLVVPSSPPPPEGLAAEIGGTSAGRAALATLLPRSEVVGTLGEALARWQPGLRIVTREGALVREDGLVLLGADSGAGTAALKRRREIAALHGTLAEADAAVARRREELEAARGAVRAAEAAVASRSAAIEAARGDLRGRENAVAEVRHRLREQESERLRATRAAEALANEGAAILRDREALDREELRANEGLAAAEGRQGAAEEAQRSRQGALEGLEPALAQAQDQAQRLRLENAGWQKDLLAAQTAERTARERADRASSRATQVDRERTDLDARLLQLGLDAEATTAKLQSLGEEQGRVRDGLEQMRERVKIEREKVRASEASAKSARERRDIARDKFIRAEGELGRVRGELDRLKEEAEQRHGLSLFGLLDRLDRDGQVLLEGWSPEGMPPGLAAEPVPVLRVTDAELEGDLGPRITALDALREAFAKVGEINPEAEDEWREASARHEELEKQRADLAEAMDIIEKAIAKINRTCRERFRETFDLVADHFSNNYPRLVGGGSGRLVLTDEEDLLTCGVELQVQPPGKRVQNLSLLSGGEKAMAAIALIFSLFRVKPSPFCLLDEVDAPLDEGNGARFNDMLRDMSQASQFIVITHNKKTMECADVLYGVTMPEPGTSRLVTVKID